MGRIDFTGLNLADLESMTEVGLALLDQWLEHAITEHNRAMKGK